MRKSYFLLPILALTIVLGSCSSSGDEETPSDPAAEAPVPAAPAAAPPAAAPPAAPAPDATAENAEEGEETSDLLTDASVVSGSVFIPSTDAEARRDATAEGRVDPFSDVPFQLVDVEFVPDPPINPVAAAPQNVPAVNALNVNSNGSSPSVAPAAPTAPAPLNPAANNNGGTGTDGGTIGGGPITAGVPTIDSLGASSTALDFTPVLPELPTAALAEATQVTGVITLNGVDNVMVKAPNDEYSRYVQVGDVIADGQVIVKRVDFRRNSPIVVLEQFGIEVYKEIDDVLLAG